MKKKNVIVVKIPVDKEGIPLYSGEVTRFLYEDLKKELGINE